MVEAAGDNLSRSFVLDLILASADQSVLAHIVAQSDTAIRFRVPRVMAPGFYRIELVVLTRWGTEIVQQPVTLRVAAEDMPTRTEVPVTLAQRR